MAKVEFDFRDGLDGSKKVYYDNRTFKCREIIGFIVYLILTWAWAAGWFALFLYSWIKDRVAAFWSYVAIWLVFMLVMIFVFFIPNLLKFYEENRKREQLEENERNDKLKELETYEEKDKIKEKEMDRLEEDPKKDQ